MSQAGLNLKHLRKIKGFTQEEFAGKLGIKRSLLGAYEEERAEPRIEILEIIADTFGLTLDDLLRNDISQAGQNYLHKRRQSKMAYEQRNAIHFVPIKAAAGYLAGYADTEFIDELNTFTLPMVGGGNYRAFEIIGDSMLPTPSGSIIVAEKVDGLNDVKNDAAYIVVSRNEGIVYKRIVKSKNEKDKLSLISDNPQFKPYQINAADVLELWQAHSIISKVTMQQRWDVNSLANLVDSLQDQVAHLKNKLN
jgi:transcriptional regulator with XRE-family HTH domain